MATPTLPAGFNQIPAGQFTDGDHKGEKVDAFGMKATPVTNAEYADLATNRSGNRYVLLRHDWNTGETKLERTGKTVEEAAGGPAFTSDEINFDQGDVIVLGSAILVKMVDNPSAKNNKEGRIFSGANQPAVGLTYFHAKAWCLLKTLESGGESKYDLPTDLQYEAVASNFGKCKYGTEACTSFEKDERKLAHIDELNNGKGTTVAVDDPCYVQNLPFGVQTTGNIWRWMQFNDQFKRPNDFLYGPYGLRGGSWLSYPVGGLASFRNDGLRPGDHSHGVGFSPVVRQDS